MRVIAFTSYMATLRALPYRIVMTYAYVNPVVAVAARTRKWPASKAILN